MKESSLRFLCCPRCHSDLFLAKREVLHNEVLSGFLKCQSCGQAYGIEDGLPDFLLPDLLNEKDKKWMFQYDRMAFSYDIIMSYVVPFFSAGVEPFERCLWAKQLQAKGGALVLDVSTGTGRNLSFIKKQMGSNGAVVAMDISSGCLAYARKRIARKGWKNVELQRANASYLPYKNDRFDAVMHVGGINTFGEKRKAIQEMVRVAKPNARIVIVDEGLASEKQKTFFGKFLIKTNALYACRPPTELVPENKKNLRVTWKIVLSVPFINLSWPFYRMEFEKTHP